MTHAGSSACACVGAMTTVPCAILGFLFEIFYRVRLAQMALCWCSHYIIKTVRAVKNVQSLVHCLSVSNPLLFSIFSASLLNKWWSYCQTWAIDLRDIQTPNHHRNIKDPVVLPPQSYCSVLNRPQLQLNAQRISDSKILGGMTHQSWPLDLLGFCSLQLGTLLPFDPNQLMFQQKDLEVFVHLYPLPLIPLEVVKLNVHLQEEQREGVTLGVLVLHGLS